MKDKKELSTIQFNGLSFFGGTKEELLKILSTQLEVNTQVRRGMLSLFTPNPEQMVLSTKNASFRKNLESADILLPDGSGIVWAIKRENVNAGSLQRLPGRELFHELLDLAERKHSTVFLLGGKEGSARDIVMQRKEQNPQLDWQYDEGRKEESENALVKIVQYRPKILCVAYGAPWQEEWICSHRQRLEEAGVQIALVVGGAFEYESGKIPPVPSLIQSMHLEWLQRLILEPWRLKRQLVGATFFLDVLLGKYRTP